MKYENPRQIRVSDIRIQDSFWSKVQNLIIDEVIPYQERILHDEVEGAEKSHAILNYRIAAGLEKGEFYGFVFQDSDVAKWLEGVAYALAVRPDPELMRRADEVIDLIGQAQQEEEYASYTCEQCGMTYAEFQKGGMLGCANCYQAFKVPLTALLFL